MHPADIQCAIKKKNLTQKQIAKEIGVCEMCVSREVNGMATSDRIRRAIAIAIGLTKEEVFPGCYCGTNRRKVRSAQRRAYQ